MTGIGLETSFAIISNQIAAARGGSIGRGLGSTATGPEALIGLETSFAIISNQIVAARCDSIGRGLGSAATGPEAS